MRRQSGLMGRAGRIGPQRRAPRPLAGRWARSVQAFLARSTAFETIRTPRPAAPEPRRAE